MSASAAGCTDGDSDEYHRNSTVTVDMFSGRANPQFPLSPEATEQLEELLAELVTVDVEAPTFDLLGFRRFRVSDVRHGGSASSVSVTPDLVVVDVAVTVLADPGGLVFSLLRSEAAEALSPADFAAIP